MQNDILKELQEFACGLDNLQKEKEQVIQDLIYLIESLTNLPTIKFAAFPRPYGFTLSPR